METYNVKISNYKNMSRVNLYLQGIVKGRKRKNTCNVQSNERTEKQIARSVNSSINRTKQKIYSYALSNDWDYFVTFTFNPKIINSSDYDECSHTLSSWLNEVRKRRCSDMIYLVVPEFHSDKKKFHFHVLMSNISNLVFVNSGHIRNNKPVFNLLDWHFGFSTAIQIDNNSDSQLKTCNYMLKYITKDLVNFTKGKKRYWVSNSTINKPEEFYYNLSQDDYENLRDFAMCNSSFAKTIEIPHSHNRVEIINI